MIGKLVLSNDLYGEKSQFINRQALHAYKVFFIHPITKQPLEIIAELPNDIKNIIQKYLLRLKRQEDR